MTNLHKFRGATKSPRSKASVTPSALTCPPLANLETGVSPPSPVSTAAAHKPPRAAAPSSLTPRLRDGAREARTAPTHSSALGYGLMLEVKRLRALLVAHGIDPDGGAAA